MCGKNTSLWGLPTFALSCTSPPYFTKLSYNIQTQRVALWHYIGSWERERMSITTVSRNTQRYSHGWNADSLSNCSPFLSLNKSLQFLTASIPLVYSCSLYWSVWLLQLRGPQQTHRSGGRNSMLCSSIWNHSWPITNSSFLAAIQFSLSFSPFPLFIRAGSRTVVYILH